MKITIVQMALEGLVDSDYPPIAIEGHISLQEAKKIASEFGSEYPTCACVEGDDSTFYANFSNKTNPKFEGRFGQDSKIDDVVSFDDKGHLELWFYHTETR